MKILITGGNGYVGRPFTRWMYREHHIAVLDSLRFGKARFAPEEETNFALYRTDIRDSAAVEYVVAAVRPDVVIHLAAINGFGRIKTALALVAITRPFRRVVAGEAGIFALSDYERDMLAHLGVGEGRIRVVTNGFNEVYLEPPAGRERAAAREKFRIGAGPVLHFMGSLHASKGVDVFLRSLHSIRGPFQAVVSGKFRWLHQLPAGGFANRLKARLIHSRHYKVSR